MSARFYLIRNVGIEDSVTGKIYTKNRDIVALLNRLNDKADGFAEKLYEIQMRDRYG